MKIDHSYLYQVYHLEQKLSHTSICMFKGIYKKTFIHIFIYANIWNE